MAPNASILVEGPIGVGKTSAMLQLYQISKTGNRFSVFLEPLKEWQEFRVPGSLETEDLLMKFYTEPSGENLRRLQMAVNVSMMRRYEEASRVTAGTVAVFERSMKVAADIFIDLNKTILPPQDVALLKEYCMVGERLFERDARHVYLTCSDEDMLRRVFQRDRQAEKNLSGARLLEIKRTMDEWSRGNGYHTIDTSNLTPKEVAAEIVLWYGEGA